MKWQPINTAPKDGRVIELAWIVNYPTVEKIARSKWVRDHWMGWYTPTHWRPAQTVTAGEKP